MQALREHLEFPQGLGHEPVGGYAGHAGGPACGDLVRVILRVEGTRVVDAGFAAEGCGTCLAAGSAVVALAHGRDVLDVARIGTHAVAAELGGLSPGKLHAAELAADALHGALGRAVAAAPQDATRVVAGRTAVAMSGGVDSAVAALLVQRSGHAAVGITVEQWADPDHDAAGSCCSALAARAARSLAHRLGLPHLTLDLRAEFRAGVVDPYLDGHRAGETPNPCVGCNGHVRLDAMLALARRVGAGTLATGHYARVTVEGLLRVAADPAKDQSYMLAAVRPATLARLRFPLGGLTKPQVRALAAEAALPVAAQPDSQDLCFLAGVGKSAFLERHGGLADQPGEIVDEAGKVLGAHLGLHHFTVGQRKGIGVAAPEPLYVLRTEPGSNRVVAGPRSALGTAEVRLRGARLHRPAAEVDRVKLRYRSRPLACSAHADGRGGVRLDLHEPADGAAPGQAACLMRGDVVVGYGTIVRA